MKNCKGSRNSPGLSKQSLLPLKRPHCLQMLRDIPTDPGFIYNILSYGMSIFKDYHMVAAWEANS